MCPACNQNPPANHWTDLASDEQQERRTSEGNRHHDPQVSKNSPNCSPTSLFTSHMNKSGEEISS
uniref:Uncharacterized protein n=1 Tax=Aegilops tauschii subsp. strangulata TaxID=200361 RepID=A0A453LRR6_AEGTS